MNKTVLSKHDERKEGFLEEKQERREFLRNLGKAALPAIAFLGLGAIGSKLHGSSEPGKGKNRKSSTSMECSECVGSCEGGCKGTCEGKCADQCGGNCEGDCSGSCKGDCSGSSKSHVLRGAKSSCKGKN
jgi:hypothetical protein